MWDLEAEYGHTDYCLSTYQEETCSEMRIHPGPEERFESSDDLATAEDANSAPQQERMFSPTQWGAEAKSHYFDIIWEIPILSLVTIEVLFNIKVLTSITCSP